jgi:hypothetical protein
MSAIRQSFGAGYQSAAEMSIPYIAVWKSRKNAHELLDLNEGG